MGKAYARQLGLLAQTYAWARREVNDSLASAVAESTCHPMIAVGSGGSLSAAHHHALLHQSATGMLAKAETPLEVIRRERQMTGVAITLISAGGRNTDVLAAFRKLVQEEPEHLLVICGSPASPLARLVSEYDYAELIEFSLPSGRPGFLATNWLLAVCVLLHRAYDRWIPSQPEVPGSFRELLELTNSARNQSFAEECRALWEVDNLIVLYGPSVVSAAIDLESKFTEAALGPVQVADFRHFAHGRHHWLAKRPSTGVVSFESIDDWDLANKTLRLIPSSIPKVRIKIKVKGALAGLAAMAQVFEIVRLAGEARGIDPGKPGVPAFGRRIYHLHPGRPPKPTLPCRLSPAGIRAIERKAGVDVYSLQTLNQLDFWVSAYRTFLRRMANTTFQAIVLDYDGTMCDSAGRFSGPNSEVMVGLVKLLKCGVVVGVATGRGRSVRTALCGSIPEVFWSKLVVGYYSGAQIAELDCESPPTGAVPPPAFDKLAEALISDAEVQALADCSRRPTQVTLTVRSTASVDRLWCLAHEILLQSDVNSASLVQSAHSVDLLAPGVSKLAVVDRVLCVAGERSLKVLCIGDQGHWPGNDAELLSQPHALSVNKVSRTPVTCWQLAPPGFRGPQATSHYLDRITIEEHGRFRFRTSSRR